VTPNPELPGSVMAGRIVHELGNVLVVLESALDGWRVGDDTSVEDLQAGIETLRNLAIQLERLVES